MFYIASSSKLKLYIIGNTQFSLLSKSKNHCYNSLYRLGYEFNEFEDFQIYSLPGEEQSFKERLIKLNKEEYKPLNRSFRHLKLILDMTGDPHVLDGLSEIKVKGPVPTAKKPYGEYKRVLLNDNQYNKLCEEFTKNIVDAVIVKLDEYIELNDNKNKYSNFYILTKRAIEEDWYNIRNKFLPKNKPSEAPNPDPVPEYVTDFLKEIK